jgi:hypothetical protein
MEVRAACNQVHRVAVVALAMGVAGSWAQSAWRRSDPDRLWQDANLAFEAGHFVLT